MNYYPFHIGDYARATRHLSWDEDMAYRRLIDAYYTREEPIPSDSRQAYRLVMASNQEQRDAVDTVLSEFFVLTDRGWVNDRCEAEIIAASVKRKKASQSAHARWNNAGSDQKENANAMQAQCERNANASKNACERIENECEGNAPNPNPNPMFTPKGVIVNSSHRGEYTEEFEVAWREYPSRPGSSKRAAFRAWEARIKDGAKPEDMTEGVKRYARYCEANRTESRFIKHAATFFGPDRHYLLEFELTRSPINGNGAPIGQKFDPTRYVNDGAYREMIDGQQTARNNGGSENGIVIDSTAQRMA